MHSLETLTLRNEFACLPKLNHPRLNALTYTVQRLPVGGVYRAALLRSVDRYAEQIIERQPDEDWDDLEALQQVTLGDIMEASLRARIESRREHP